MRRGSCRILLLNAEKEWREMFFLYKWRCGEERVGKFYLIKKRLNVECWECCDADKENVKDVTEETFKEERTC